MFIMVKNSTKYIYKGVSDVSTTQIKVTEDMIDDFNRPCVSGAILQTML